MAGLVRRTIPIVWGCLNGVWWIQIAIMQTVRSVCRSSDKAASAVTVGVMSGRTK